MRNRLPLLGLLACLLMSGVQADPVGDGLTAWRAGDYDSAHRHWQAAANGADVLSKLAELQAKYPQVLAGYRGKGLLIGMEFASDETGYKVASGLFKRHVLTAGTLTNARAIRIEPALNIPYELLDEILTRLEDTFKSIA